jgi:hypothetical protein
MSASRPLSPQQQGNQLATSWAVVVYARPVSVGLPDFKFLFGAQCGPCFKAFLFPFGAPGDFPRCIRQRSFGMAGDWQRLPLLVLAPHRWHRCTFSSSTVQARRELPAAWTGPAKRSHTWRGNATCAALIGNTRRPRAGHCRTYHTFRDCLENFNKILTFTFFRVRLFSRRCVGRVDLKTLAVVNLPEGRELAPFLLPDEQYQRARQP